MNAKLAQKMKQDAIDEFAYTIAFKNLIFALRMGGVLVGTTRDIDNAISSGRMADVIDLHRAELFCSRNHEHVSWLYRVLEEMAT